MREWIVPRLKYVYLLVIAVLLALPLIFTDQFILHNLILVLLAAYFAMSWNILGGFAGQFSLGHCAYTGIAGYTSTILLLQWNVSPWLGMFAGGFIAVLLSIAIGYPTFRLRGPYFVLATIALGTILKDYFSNTANVFGLNINGTSGLLIPLRHHAPLYMQFSNKSGYYWLMLTLFLIVLFVSYLIKRSKLGYQLTAVAENQDAGAALGVNVVRVKLYAGMISAFFTGLGGVFLAQYNLYIDPLQFFGFSLSIDMALMTIVGGTGTILGPVLGAVIMRPLSEITRMLLGGARAGAHGMVYAILLILVVLFMPKGLMGLFGRRQQKVDQSEEHDLNTSNLQRGRLE
jgi:branched-chain amino acid transport system permease protein